MLHNKREVKLKGSVGTNQITSTVTFVLDLFHGALMGKHREAGRTTPLLWKVLGGAPVVRRW